MMIIGFDGVELTPRHASVLSRLQPAGVILFARNIKSPEQTWRLLRDCQNCVAKPLFTCVDLEGGTVDRFCDVLGPTPSAAEVYATGDPRLYRKHGQIIAENCRALGFNIDFAPVLDLAFEPSRDVMSSRAVSANPKEAIAYAREFLAGLKNAKVLGCGKHFPGLGEGKLDSHHELPMIDKSLKQMWNEDLLPYRVLKKDLPVTMVSHAAYPQVAKSKTPASLSEVWIRDILRKKIGYKNLIVSDDLEMGGVLAAASVGEAAAEFVAAGGDLCLVCHHEELVLQAHEQLTRRTEREREFAKRAAESVRRVLAFKKKCAKVLRASPVPSTRTIEKLRRRLWEFSEQVRLEPLGRREDRQRRA